MRNVHRPHNGELDYGIALVEIDENGVETVVPTELICTAKPITLQDYTLKWVSDKEDKRVHEALQDVYLATASVSDIILAADDEGYEAISTIIVFPEDGFLEHHVLCRHRQSLECVALVFTLIVFEADGKEALSGFITRNYDSVHDTRILRIVDPADIELASEKGLLCSDEDGHHVQVLLYRSVLWQCFNHDKVDQECLRLFWRHLIRKTS